MKMKLKELPDCKIYPLTVGNEYEILRTFGNGYVIQSDENPDSKKQETLILLQSRFE